MPRNNSTVVFARSGLRAVQMHALGASVFGARGRYAWAVCVGGLTGGIAGGLSGGLAGGLSGVSR